VLVILPKYPRPKHLAILYLMKEMEYKLIYIRHTYPKN